MPDEKTVCGDEASAAVLVPVALDCQNQLCPAGAEPVALMVEPVAQLGAVAVGVAGFAGGGPKRNTLPLAGSSVVDIAIVAVEEFDTVGADQEFVLPRAKTFAAPVEDDLRPTCTVTADVRVPALTVPYLISMMLEVSYNQT